MFHFLDKKLDANKARTNKEIEAMLLTAMKSGAQIQNVSYFDNIENYKRFQGVYLHYLYDCKDGVNGRNHDLGRKMNEVGIRHDFNCVYSLERYLERQRRLKAVAN